MDTVFCEQWPWRKVRDSILLSINHSKCKRKTKFSEAYIQRDRFQHSFHTLYRYISGQNVVSRIHSLKRDTDDHTTLTLKAIPCQTDTNLYNLTFKCSYSQNLSKFFLVARRNLTSKKMLIGPGLIDRPPTMWIWTHRFHDPQRQRHRLRTAQKWPILPSCPSPGILHGPVARSEPARPCYVLHQRKSTMQKAAEFPSIETLQ